MPAPFAEPSSGVTVGACSSTATAEAACSIPCRGPVEARIANDAAASIGDKVVLQQGPGRPPPRPSAEVAAASLPATTAAAAASPWSDLLRDCREHCDAQLRCMAARQDTLERRLEELLGLREEVGRERRRLGVLDQQQATLGAELRAVAARSSPSSESLEAQGLRLTALHSMLGRWCLHHGLPGSIAPRLGSGRGGLRPLLQEWRAVCSHAAVSVVHEPSPLSVRELRQALGRASTRLEEHDVQLVELRRTLRDQPPSLADTEAMLQTLADQAKVVQELQGVVRHEHRRGQDLQGKVDLAARRAPGQPPARAAGGGSELRRELLERLAAQERALARLDGLVCRMGEVLAKGGAPAEARQHEEGEEDRLSDLEASVAELRQHMRLLVAAVRHVRDGASEAFEDRLALALSEGHRRATAADSTTSVQKPTNGLHSHAASRTRSASRESQRDHDPGHKGTSAEGVKAAGRATKPIPFPQRALLSPAPPGAEDMGNQALRVSHDEGPALTLPTLAASAGGQHA